MGGNVFHSLDVPRMSPELYTTLRSKFTDILRQFYKEVLTPAEAPGKADYGDIDFLVSSPLSTMDTGAATKESHWTVLAEAFDASVTADRYAGAASFAIQTNNKSDQGATFAQIDVHVLPHDLLAWSAFRQSYGDMCQLLSLVIRSFGLVPNDRGLFIRAADIEAEADTRTESLFFLTKDPVETMKFLGLNIDAYYRGFDTENDIFEWIGNSRLFSRQAFMERIEKAADRQHLRKRVMHRRFVREWVLSPAAIAKDKGGVDRETVFQEAVSWFGIDEVYERALLQFRVKQEEKKFWAKVAAAIPLEGRQLSLAIRSLHRWVTFDKDGLEQPVEPVIRLSPCLNVAEQPLWSGSCTRGRTESELQSWAVEHYVETMAKEEQRVADDLELRIEQNTRCGDSSDLHKCSTDDE